MIRRTKGKKLKYYKLQNYKGLGGRKGGGGTVQEKECFVILCVCAIVHFVWNS